MTQSGVTNCFEGFHTFLEPFEHLSIYRNSTQTQICDCHDRFMVPNIVQFYPV